MSCRRNGSGGRRRAGFLGLGSAEKLPEESAAAHDHPPMDLHLGQSELSRQWLAFRAAALAQIPTKAYIRRPRADPSSRRPTKPEGRSLWIPPVSNSSSTAPGDGVSARRT